jgi:hypothetical protein
MLKFKKFLLKLITLFLLINPFSEKILAFQSDKEIVKKGFLNQEIKKKNYETETQEMILKNSDPELEKLPFTQTEAYLKIMLEKEGKYNDNLFENIKYYFENYCKGKRKFETYDYLSPEKLYKVIKNEKHFSGYHVFYNGLNQGLGFVYEIINHLKQRIMISASKDSQRTYARFFEEMFKKHSTIQEWAEEFNYLDKNLEYQKRIASTNVFLFGNTDDVTEQTLAYANKAKQIDLNTKPLIAIKDIFMFLGDDEETSFKRLARYVELYNNTAALNQCYVLQQIFVANNIIDKVTYPSWAYGRFNRLSNSKSKNITKISEAFNRMRKDPVEFTKDLISTIEKTKFQYEGLEAVDKYQARLLLDPKAIENNQMIIIPWNFWEENTEKTQKEWEKEQALARKELDKLIEEDLQEFLLTSEALKDFPLHKLKLFREKGLKNQEINE